MSWTRKLPSGKFQGNYYDGSGKVHTRTCLTKREASVWATEQERDVRRNRHFDPHAGKMLIADYEAKWWAARVCEETTRVTDRGRLDRHILPRWGDTPLDAVMPTAVQGWVRQLGADGLAPATVRSCHQLLASVLEGARRDGLVPDNAARGVRLPAAPPGRETYLTQDQVDWVVEQMDDDAATVALCLAYTGMRWGEVAGLHLKRVDLLRRRIDVVETLVEVGGTRTVKEYPKSRRRRTVPIPGVLVDALAAYLARHPAEQDELVFRPALSRHTWGRSHLAPALRAAGLSHVRVHDLRHSCASWLAQDGVPLADIMRQLGHQSIQTTMRYAHFVPDAYDNVLGTLDRPRPLARDSRRAR